MQEQEAATTSGKHAYLVIAHKDDTTFRTLLRLLDDARNDIFVHIDAKNADWDESLLGSLVEKSGCFAVSRIDGDLGVLVNYLRAQAH